MKIIAAIDSFKGSLSSIEAGEAVREGILDIFEDAEVVIKPIADGGEGTVDALIRGMNGTEHKILVTGPMGEPVEARYGIVSETTAVMEMAAAAGITLVPREERNPVKAGTYGVGEMIAAAIGQGCRSFLIGIGGSATNDCGMGMLQALGYRFQDCHGCTVPPIAEGLKDIVEVDDTGVIPELKECCFRIACDVKNPLCGPDGASFVYGPQKGAGPVMVRQLDEALAGFAKVTARFIGKDLSEEAGTGAAGGLGYAFLAYLNGKLEPGIDIVLDTIGLEEDVKTADIVITGEGRLDAQTVMGKAPAGVARLAKRYGCTVVALAGGIAEDAQACNQNGIDAYFPILQTVCTLEEAMEKENARKNMVSTVRQIFRLVKTVK